MGGERGVEMARRAGAKNQQISNGGPPERACVRAHLYFIRASRWKLTRQIDQDFDQCPTSDSLTVGVSSLPPRVPGPPPRRPRRLARPHHSCQPRGAGPPAPQYPENGGRQKSGREVTVHRKTDASFCTTLKCYFLLWHFKWCIVFSSTRYEYARNRFIKKNCAPMRLNNSKKLEVHILRYFRPIFKYQKKYKSKQTKTSKHRSVFENVCWEQLCRCEYACF